GLTARQVPGAGNVELLVDLLLLHRPAQLPVFLDGHHHRHHLATLTNHVVGVTIGQFAHEGHGNEVDRQHDVTTRHRSTKGGSEGWTPGDPRSQRGSTPPNEPSLT